MYLVSQTDTHPAKESNQPQLGAPGAGKGSLCKKLAKKHGFRHLSIGDLLRQVAASPGADKTVVEYVRRGELLTTELLFHILKPHIKEGGTIMLDGFPRRLDQAKAFEEQVRITSPHPRYGYVSNIALVSVSYACSILRLSERIGRDTSSQ